MALGAQALVLGAEDAAGLWGRADGSGCGNEIVKAAFAAAGVPVELRVLPYARAKEGVLSGTLAGCFSMSPAPELEGRVVLAREPLYAAAAMVVRRKDRHGAVRSLDAIPRDAVVGIVQDYEYPGGIWGLAARGVRLAPNVTEVANLEMLAAGRLAFAVLQVDELKSFEGLLASAGVQGEIDTAFTLPKVGSYVGFSLAHPRGRWAKKQFDRGYALIRSNGTLRAILKAWKGRPS